MPATKLRTIPGHNNFCVTVHLFQFDKYFIDAKEDAAGPSCTADGTVANMAVVSDYNVDEYLWHFEICS